MLEPPPNRLLQTLRRLGAETDLAAGDADLLAKFVADRDEFAFGELLRRHGDMVLRVCRRHLSGSDADDAFQAVFLVLARDAARIARRESLAGWLYRVAYHVSRKLMGKNARHRALPVREDDASNDPGSDRDRDELRSIIEREVNSLPDRLRGPVVLCYLEGRSNSEAAELLGCPKGTVDSRLSTARKQLHARLLRRGVALGSLPAIEAALASREAVASAGLARRTLEAVMLFARTGSAAGAVTSHVLSLVAGVSQTMTTNRMTLLVALAVLFTTLGGAGITVMNVKADGQPPKNPQGKEPGYKPGGKVDPPPAAKLDSKIAEKSDAISGLLRQPLGIDKPIDEIPFKSFIELLTDRHKIPIRIDLAACTRMGYASAVNLYEQPVRLPVVNGLTLGDALNDVLSQLSTNAAESGLRFPLTFRVREGQIIVLPGYLPTIASVGGGNPNVAENTALTPEQLLEQDEGGPVSISVDEKPLTDILKELRATTGANIVLDARQKDKAKLMITVSLHDVRLMAALRILGDMCELQPVALNNVFYVTSQENAERLQKEIDRRRYGEQHQGGVGGFGLGGPLPMTPMPMPNPPAKEGKDPTKK